MNLPRGKDPIKVERSILALKDKLKRGEWPTTPPVGYTYLHNDVDFASKDCRGIIINDLEAPMIKEIFELYATKAYTLDAVRKHIAKKYERPFPKATIHKILKNKFYYGIMVVSGIEYPHYYERIIDKNLFEQCQNVAGSKAKSHNGVYGQRAMKFRALMVCKECNCLITGEIHTKRKLVFKYYHCTQSKYNHKAPWITEDFLDRALTVALKQLHDDIRVQVQEVIKDCSLVAFRIILKDLFTNITIDQFRTISFKMAEKWERYPISSWANLFRKIELSVNPDDPKKEPETTGDPILMVCIDPKTMEQVQRETGIDFTELTFRIGDLEMEGFIKEIMPGVWKTV